MVFVVDDDTAVRDALSRLFRSAAFSVQAFGSGDEFLSEYEETSRACVIIDIRMPGMDGFTLKKRMAERGIDLPVIMITGHGDAATEERARQVGAVALFHKPFEDELLLETADQAIANAFDLH